MTNKETYPVLVEMIETAIEIARGKAELRWQVENLSRWLVDIDAGVKPQNNDIQWIRDFILRNE